jgi:hypothetical protein
MVSRRSSVIVSLNRKKKQKNQTKKQNKKTPKIPHSVPISNAIQFQQVFQHVGVVQLLSYQTKRERKKKKESGDCSVNVYLRL